MGPTDELVSIVPDSGAYVVVVLKVSDVVADTEVKAPEPPAKRGRFDLF
jgi:hypothetical protein